MWKLKLQKVQLSKSVGIQTQNMLKCIQKTRQTKRKTLIISLKNMFLDLIKDIEKAGLQNAVFSNPIDKEKGSKITVHPILLKGEAVYQRTSFIGTKVFHENLVPDRLAEQLTQDMQAFKQAEFTTPDFSRQWEKKVCTCRCRPL